MMEYVAEMAPTVPGRQGAKKILSRINRIITRKMLLIQASEVSARFVRM
jgi:hypothetical protein